MSPRQQVLVAIFLALLPLGVILQGYWVAGHKGNFTPFLVKFQIEKTGCPYCEGTGMVREDGPQDDAVMCPICFGTGSHWFRKLDPEADVLCPACGGMGRLYDPVTGQPRWCERCNGRGLIRTAPSSSKGEKNTLAADPE